MSKVVSKTDVIIVGAGPSGVAAAVQCKRLGLSVTLLDRTGIAGGLAAAANRIENYPGLPPLGGREFVRLLGDHLDRFELKVRLGLATAVTPIPDGFEVLTNDGDFQSRAVIVAVGTEPKTIDIQGFEHVRYSPLEVPRDAGLSAAIIGGGEAALDYALSLADKGVFSCILVRGGALKAHGILPDRVSRNERVRILFHADPKEIAKTPDGLRVGFHDASLPPIHTHFVLAAVGRRASTFEILRGFDLGSPESVSTGAAGLFLVGDARAASLGQIGIAVGDGLRAAMKVRELISVSRPQSVPF